MKKILLLSAFIFALSTTFAQVGSTYTVLSIPSANYQWGKIIPTTGAVNNPAVLIANLAIETNAGCMNDDTGIIYFMELFSSNSPAIVSLNVTSGTVSKQNVGNVNIAVLEYSNVTGKTYFVRRSPTGDQWGEIDPTTGLSSNTMTINTLLGEFEGIAQDGSSINAQTGLIYFLERNINTDVQSIVSLNTNNGSSSKRLVSQEIRFLEYHSGTGKIYTLTEVGNGLGWAEIDPTTGTVSNATAFPTAVNYLDDLPGTCMDQQNGIMYLGDYDFEGAATSNIIGINVVSGMMTKQATTYDISVLEHWNNVATAVTPADLAESAFRIFPNPMTGQFQIRVTNAMNIASLNLYTTSGQSFALTQDADGKVSLPNALASGIYVLEITTQKGQKSRQRIVKN